MFLANLLLLYRIYQQVIAIQHIFS